MEIERKYRLSEAQLRLLVPNSDNFVLETRYYLYCQNDNEIRITQRGNGLEANFTLDRMELLREDTDEYFVRRKQRIVISEVEFNALVALVPKQQPVQRLHFKLNEQIELKIYQGRHAGLIRAEVEFPTIAEAENFKPDFQHSGEITNTPLGRDVLLANLSVVHIKQALAT